MSCIVVSCRVLSCLALPCLALPCLLLSCLVWHCLVLSWLVLSRPVFYCHVPSVSPPIFALPIARLHQPSPDATLTHHRLPYFSCHLHNTSLSPYLTCRTVQNITVILLCGIAFVLRKLQYNYLFVQCCWSKKRAATRYIPRAARNIPQGTGEGAASPLVLGFPCLHMLSDTVRKLPKSTIHLDRGHALLGNAMSACPGRSLD